MKLNKLKIKNIRSYNDEEVIFPEGSTILAGDIGAGKTTILLAIEFALFGLQPGQKGTSLLRNGSEEALVSLEMEIEGRKVIVERGLKKGKSVNQSSAVLEIDGARNEMSVTELKNRILELLNYPKEFAKKTNLLYRFTVYTPQEEMKQIILEDSETRLDTLRHIFGIDKYKKIRENVDLFAIKLRENARELDGEIKNLDEMKIKLEEKNGLVKKLEHNLTELQVNLDSQKIARQLAEVAIKDVEDKIKEKNNFEKEL